MSIRQRWLLHLLALVAIAASVQLAEADVAAWPPADVVQRLLRARALVHGADPREVLAVARCETGGTWSPWLVGGHGERGVGQWLPGRGNAWDATPAWREQRIDIVRAYRSGDPDAVWLDVDQFAWAMSQDKLLKRQWTCWRMEWGR